MVDLKEMGDRSGLWTNEKHISFLNWMEASFVRRMLENDDRSSLSYAHGNHPRLDRFLPDIADSTLDFTKEKNKRKNHLNNGIVERNIRNGDHTDDRGMENSPPYDASQDQVVPQLGSIKGDKNERDELAVAVSVASANRN